MLRIIIVEDDPLISYDLKDIAESEEHEVVSVFHSAEEFLKEQNHEADLALLDVNLGDGQDGISLGLSIKKEFKIPCIFITSYYDKNTVARAQEVSPLAYILKPYEEQHIITNLKLAESKLSKSNNSIEDKPIFVKNGANLTKIDPKLVDFVKAYDVYSQIYIGGKRITASQTLKEVEKLFSSLNFIRVHRSFMVNLNAIDGISDGEILIAENRIPVGRTYKKDLYDRILTI